MIGLFFPIEAAVTRDKALCQTDSWYQVRFRGFESSGVIFFSTLASCNLSIGLFICSTTDVSLVVPLGFWLGFGLAKEILSSCKKLWDLL